MACKLGLSKAVIKIQSISAWLFSGHCTEGKSSIQRSYSRWLHFYNISKWPNLRNRGQISSLWMLGREGEGGRWVQDLHSGELHSTRLVGTQIASGWVRPEPRCMAVANVWCDVLLLSAWDSATGGRGRIDTSVHGNFTSKCVRGAVSLWKLVLEADFCGCEMSSSGHASAQSSLISRGSDSIQVQDSSYVLVTCVLLQTKPCSRIYCLVNFTNAVFSENKEEVKVWKRPFSRLLPCFSYI